MQNWKTYHIDVEVNEGASPKITFELLPTDVVPYTFKPSCTCSSITWSEPYLYVKMDKVKIPIHLDNEQILISRYIEVEYDNHPTEKLSFSIKVNRKK